MLLKCFQLNRAGFHKPESDKFFGGKQLFIPCPSRAKVIQGEVLMFMWLVRLTLLVAVLGWVSGCSTMLPERKVPTESPKILEEDVQGGSSVHPKPEEGQAPSNLDLPAAPPPEGSPPGSWPPRRLKFRDRGLERGMEFRRTGEPYVG